MHLSIQFLQINYTYYLYLQQMITRVAHHQFSLNNLTIQELESLRYQTLTYLEMLNYQQNLQNSILFLNAKIQIGKQLMQSETILSRKGRGGNNTAENMKKSVLSLLRRKLSTNVYDQFQERFIKVYNIKSQKQNLVLIFLLLEILNGQQKISRKQIDELNKETKLKIEKYIANSTLRMQQEEGRKEFHQKNIAEFRKFQKIDLDFRQPRNYQELKIQIESFYLRKKQEFKKAQIKMRRIIQSASCLKRIFEIQDSIKSIDQTQRTQSFEKKCNLDCQIQESSCKWPQDD